MCSDLVIFPKPHHRFFYENKGHKSTPKNGGIERDPEDEVRKRKKP